MNIYPGAMTTELLLPDIPESEKTPLVRALLEIIERQNVRIVALEARIVVLEEEIKTLKGLNQRPKISPSKMDKDTSQSDGDDGNKKKNKNHKERSKKDNLKIDVEYIVKPENIPADAIFKGYTDFIVQDLDIKAITAKYRLGRFELPDGNIVVGELPEDLQGKHFGPKLRAFVVSQYYFQHVTQRELLKLVRSFGVDISSGQLSEILTKDKDAFHQEKNEILKVGLASSEQANTDDTGARHKGKNGFCTHIGNEFFAWFESTDSKSRINFLELLRQEHKDYLINDNAIAYCKKHNLPAYVIEILEQNFGLFQDQEAFLVALKKMNITQAAHTRIVTEAGLMGSILSHGFNVEFRLISDDAGQFNIFQHALCWIHAERKFKALHPLNKKQEKQFESVLNQFWEIYNDLKAYKQNPKVAVGNSIRRKFNRLCTFKTDSLPLQKTLKKLQTNKAELLLVLRYPDLPLHNNLSERDIREYVRMRKTNGSTRSDDGRRCRDTFASLKKTCMKLGVNTWDFLVDRHKKVPQMIRLPELMKIRINEAKNIAAIA